MFVGNESAAVGSFSFSRYIFYSSVSLLYDPFRRSRKVIIRSSWSHPISHAPEKFRVRLICTLARKRFLTMM